MWNFPNEFLGKPNNLEQYYKTKPTGNEDDGGGVGLIVAPFLFIIFIFAYYSLFILAVPFLPLSIISYEFSTHFFSHVVSMSISAATFIFTFIFMIKAQKRSGINEFLFWGVIYLFSISALFYLGKTVDNSAAVESLNKLIDIKDFFEWIASWIKNKL